MFSKGWGSNLPRCLHGCLHTVWEACPYPSCIPSPVPIICCTTSLWQAPIILGNVPAAARSVMVPPQPQTKSAAHNPLQTGTGHQQSRRWVPGHWERLKQCLYILGIINTNYGPHQEPKHATKHYFFQALTNKRWLNIAQSHSGKEENLPLEPPACNLSMQHIQKLGGTWPCCSISPFI